MIAVPVAELLDRDLARWGMAVDVGDLAAYRAMPREALHAVKVGLAWIEALAGNVAWICAGEAVR